MKRDYLYQLDSKLIRRSTMLFYKSVFLLYLNDQKSL